MTRDTFSKLENVPNMARFSTPIKIKNLFFNLFTSNLISQHLQCSWQRQTYPPPFFFVLFTAIQTGPAMATLSHTHKHPLVSLR